MFCGLMRRTCSRIDVKVHGVITEILIQANQVPGLELNLISTENKHSVWRISMIYNMILHN